MSSTKDFDKRRVDMLAALKTDATERFDRELDEVRAAASACYEEAFTRLRNAGWVPLNAVSRLVEDLSAVLDLERARASSLAADLDAAKRDLEAGKREMEAARAQCQAAVQAAREAAARERDEAVAQFNRDLNAARERAESTAAAEARVREELAAVRLRSQEIVDAQMLAMVDFKRQLEQASAMAERARAETDNAVDAAATRPVKVTEAAAEIQPQAGTRRNEQAPEFAAIEAVLAGSPPLGAWRAAGNL